jgi:hypothetical protein
MTATPQARPATRPTSKPRAYWNLGSVTRAMLLVIAIFVGVILLFKGSVLGCVLIWITAAIMFSIEKGLYLFWELNKNIGEGVLELQNIRRALNSKKSNDASGKKGNEE